MGQIKAYFLQHTNPPVFLISTAMVVFIVTTGALFPEIFGNVTSAMLAFITEYFGWLYIAAMAFFVPFVLFIAISRWGRLKLGPADSKPEFATLPWISMMFTCGMGTGLVYYGVAQPIMLFKNPADGSAGGSEQAALEAMNWTFFHWALQPWAMYIVMGMALGFFCYRRGLPLKPASTLYPLLGERVHGPIGHAIDILFVFGTLFGLATSIGVGANQIASGFQTLFSVSDGITTQLLVILAVELVAIISVMLGVKRGIRRLSIFNSWLAIALAVFVLVVGPTLYILTTLVNDTGYYLQHYIGTSLKLWSDGPGAEFQSAWTLFYWGWWISWSPFVGLFIARISYGYSLRQFILGTLFIPAGASIVWFSIFGGSALFYVLNGGNEALMDSSASNAIFVLFNQLPIDGMIATLAGILMIVVVTLFFATSSDSGSLVIDIITNGGDPNPVWQQRLFWAITEGVIAAVLLTVGSVTGGDPLSAIQSAAVSAGLPVCVLLLLICWALVKGLNQETAAIEKQQTQGNRRSVHASSH